MPLLLLGAREAHLGLLEALRGDHGAIEERAHPLVVAARLLELGFARAMIRLAGGKLGPGRFQLARQLPARHVLLRPQLALQRRDPRDLGVDPLQLEPSLPAFDADQEVAAGDAVAGHHRDRRDAALDLAAHRDHVGGDPRNRRHRRASSGPPANGRAPRCRRPGAGRSRRGAEAGGFGGPRRSRACGAPRPAGRTRRPSSSAPRS